ncbi:WYL domain-containing protein [uncultured Draconibacterium sp.]|uniref:helix-turn-helix transcriptional regulator n=1 Tax=uncultured Draconibacterium sp. TaxID=1573823 RepID=UPI0025D942B1|nr:WYL domain-containing protein [uncultured Draconibacterium sp.]
MFDEIKIQRLETFKTVLKGAKDGVLKSTLAEKLGSNTKTIERYVNDLRSFGIAIQSLGRPVYYSIDYDNSESLELFEYILNNQFLSTHLLSIINEKDQNKRFLLDYVDFEHHHEFRGIDYFDKLFSAITSSNCIRFSYKSYYYNKELNVILKPFLIKEYNYRWYVTGFKDNGEIRIYGLDRITSEIKFTGEHFKLPDDFNRKEIYENTIGVTISKEHETIEPVEIVFEIDSTIANHAESLKMHPSQKILESGNPDTIRFSIYARPNYELWHTFLQYIPHIKILSPAPVKSYFITLLQKTVEKNQ